MITIYTPTPFSVRDNNCLPCDFQDYEKTQFYKQVTAQNLRVQATRATPKGSIKLINFSNKRPQTLESEYIQ